MFKNILIILVSSFIFDFIFGAFLMKRPELFSKIQNAVPKTKVRYFYKLIFLMIMAVIAILLKRYFNINDTIIAIILGLAISISGALFNTSKDQIKK